MKKSVKIVAVLLILVLVGVASFLTFFSEDSGGLRQGLLKKNASPSAATGSITPSLTIESYTAGVGNDGYLIGDVRLEWSNPSCDESSYAHIGYWKLNSNMAIAARGFKFWTYFSNQMVDYKVLVGTAPDSKSIAIYEVNEIPNNFSALKPGNAEFTLPANQDVYVTLLGKYKATINHNDVVTGGVAMKEKVVIGDFVGTAGNRIPVVAQYVQNNQTDFTAGFTEIGPYDGLSCNQSE